MKSGKIHGKPFAAWRNILWVPWSFMNVPGWWSLLTKKLQISWIPMFDHTPRWKWYLPSFHRKNWREKWIPTAVKMVHIVSQAKSCPRISIEETWIEHSFGHLPIWESRDILLGHCFNIHSWILAINSLRLIRTSSLQHLLKTILWRRCEMKEFAWPGGRCMYRVNVKQAILKQHWIFWRLGPVTHVTHLTHAKTSELVADL